MAMVTITGDTVRDASGRPDNRPWKVRATAYQDGGGTGGVITLGEVTVWPVAGVLSFEVEAGTGASVETPDGKRYLVTIPGVDTGLWELIETAVTLPPSTSAEALEAALAAYFTANPPTQADWVASSGSSQILNKPAVIAAGATEAAARAAIGAQVAGSYATGAQGAKADSAVQPGALGTAAAEDVEAFATPGDVSAKYTKPGSGIPASDMAAAVQASLGKADTAYQAPAVVAAGADAAAARGAIGALSQAEIENLIGSYEAETLALIGRMAVRPDATHRSAINTLIVALKTAGIWAKLDGLHLLAAHTEQAALLNWVTAARDLTSFNTPTFTADRGITGGGTSYLATSSSFSGAGLLMDDGDESIGVWVRTNVVDNSANSVTLATNNSGGSTVRYINPRNASTVVAWKMNFATTQGSLPHASGDNTLYVATRNPTDAYLYFNGAQDDSFTAAISDDPRALSMWFLVGRTATAYSTRQHCAGFYGRYLNASEQAQLYNALLDYMTALGAV